MNRSIRIVLLVVIGTLVLLSTPPITFNIDDYWYEVVDDAEGNPGGGLQIDWSEPYMGGSNIFGCSSSNDKEEDIRYIITVDGVDVDTVVETTYTLYTPAKLVELTALIDMEYTSESPAEIDLTTVTSPALVVWSIEDTTGFHPSGFGFDVGYRGDGDALAYMIGEGYDESIDFYIDTNLVLTASRQYEPEALNYKSNWVCEHDVAYDSVRIVKPFTVAEGNYTFEITCETDGVYGLRIEYIDESYFAKIKVLNIDGYEIAFKIDVQLERNLRWVVVD